MPAVAALVALALQGPAIPAAASTWGVGLSPASAALGHSGGPPPAPASVSASCVAGLPNEIQVTWSAVSGASTYSVYQSTSSATSGYSLAVSGVATTAWQTSGLQLGTYWFEVAALIGSNWQGPDSAATSPRTILVAACI